MFNLLKPLQALLSTDDEFIIQQQSTINEYKGLVDKCLLSNQQMQELISIITSNQNSPFSNPVWCWALFSAFLCMILFALLSVAFFVKLGMDFHILTTKLEALERSAGNGNNTQPNGLDSDLITPSIKHESEIGLPSVDNLPSPTVVSHSPDIKSTCSCESSPIHIHIHLATTSNIPPSNVSVSVESTENGSTRSNTVVNDGISNHSFTLTSQVEHSEEPSLTQSPNTTSSTSGNLSLQPTDSVQSEKTWILEQTSIDNVAWQPTSPVDLDLLCDGDSVGEANDLSETEIDSEEAPCTQSPKMEIDEDYYEIQTPCIVTGIINETVMDDIVENEPSSPPRSVIQLIDEIICEISQYSPSIPSEHKPIDIILPLQLSCDNISLGENNRNSGILDSSITSSGDHPSFTGNQVMVPNVEDSDSDHSLYSTSNTSEQEPIETTQPTLPLELDLSSDNISFDESNLHKVGSDILKPSCSPSNKQLISGHQLTVTNTDDCGSDYSEENHETDEDDGRGLSQHDTETHLDVVDLSFTPLNEQQPIVEYDDNGDSSDAFGADAEGITCDLEKDDVKVVAGHKHTVPNAEDDVNSESREVSVADAEDPTPVCPAWQEDIIICDQPASPTDTSDFSEEVYETEVEDLVCLEKHDAKEYLDSPDLSFTPLNDLQSVAAENYDANTCLGISPVCAQDERISDLPPSSNDTDLLGNNATICQDESTDSENDVIQTTVSCLFPADLATPASDGIGGLLETTSTSSNEIDNIDNLMDDIISLLDSDSIQHNENDMNSCIPLITSPKDPIVLPTDNVTPATDSIGDLLETSSTSSNETVIIHDLSEFDTAIPYQDCSSITELPDDSIILLVPDDDMMHTNENLILSTKSDLGMLDSSITPDDQQPVTGQQATIKNDEEDSDHSPEVYETDEEDPVCLEKHDTNANLDNPGLSFTPLNDQQPGTSHQSTILTAEDSKEINDDNILDPGSGNHYELSLNPPSNPSELESIVTTQLALPLELDLPCDNISFGEDNLTQSDPGILDLSITPPGDHQTFSGHQATISNVEEYSDSNYSEAVYESDEEDHVCLEKHDAQSYIELLDFTPLNDQHDGNTCLDISPVCPQDDVIYDSPPSPPICEQESTDKDSEHPIVLPTDNLTSADKDTLYESNVYEPHEIIPVSALATYHDHIKQHVTNDGCLDSYLEANFGPNIEDAKYHYEKLLALSSAIKYFETKRKKRYLKRLWKDSIIPFKDFEKAYHFRIDPQECHIYNMDEFAAIRSYLNINEHAFIHCFDDCYLGVQEKYSSRSADRHFKVHFIHYRTAYWMHRYISKLKEYIKTNRTSMVQTFVGLYSIGRTYCAIEYLPTPHQLGPSVFIERLNDYFVGRKSAPGDGYIPSYFHDNVKRAQQNLALDIEFLKHIGSSSYGLVVSGTA